MSIKTPVRQGDRWHIYDAEEAHVCCCNREEQAAEIVTAVNSLPALVAALRLRLARAGLYDALYGGEEDYARLSVPYAMSLIEQIDEALKGADHA